MTSQRLNICFFLSKYVWFSCVSMTHNDFDHLAQLLPEERSPCAVDSSMLHSVFIRPGFVAAIFILQSFFQLHSLSIATLQLHSKDTIHWWLKVSKSTFFSKPFLVAYSWKASKQLQYANILWEWGIYLSSVL